jgi:hypothetical protein
VNGPLMGEFQFVCHRGNDFRYSEGSMVSGCKLYCSIWQGQVLGFEPDLLSLFVVHFCQGFIVCKGVECRGGKDSVLLQLFCASFGKLVV